MSRWSDLYDNLPIHQALSQLMDWLNVEVTDIDPDHAVERRRLNKTLRTIADIIAGMDHEFFPEQQINQLNQHLRQAPLWNNLNTYSNGPNVQQLKQANDHLTASLPQILQLAALSRQPEARSVISAIEEAHDAFCRNLERHESEFKTRLQANTELLAKLDQNLAALREAHKQLNKDTEAALAAWQTEFTDAQTSRAEEFSKLQIERGTKFDDALREWRTKSEAEIKDISAKHTEKLNNAFDSYKSEAETRIADMKVKHKAILEIHGLVGTDGVAGGYQRGATDERSEANRWRLISMGSLAVAAIWILIRYILGFDLKPDGSVNWEEIVTAASLTVVLLGAAGYAARQSKLHRDTEQHMRWFALEVKAIDPFLSSLPVEQQNELKKQLSQKLFGQERVTTGDSEGNVDPAAFKTITDAFLSIAKIMKH